jgi:hypothetical protein
LAETSFLKSSWKKTEKLLENFEQGSKGSNHVRKMALAAMSRKDWKGDQRRL